MADYRILIEAETAKAEKDLRRLDTVAEAAARDRKLNFKLPSLNDATNGIEKLKTGIEGAANNIKTFYSVSKQLPVVGDKVRNVEDAFNTTRSAIDAANESINRGVGAGDLLSRAFDKVSNGAGALVNNLAKIGFAMFGLQQIVGVLQDAFGSFFASTIGREIQLRETLLKTQTTVASMSDVFVGDRKLTDPLEKIKALTKSVEKNVDSIRERSLELAGVTSGEVVEVFGIVAGQIGQVNGGLKEAEDLAISFSAALGTFALPLQQARQEITSMLQGNVGPDSYLARALGITNPDIAKARTQAGGVIKFIQDKLATAVAGQKLAAQSFSGVMSNIRELGELIGQKFGRGLLDPLLSGITFIYNKLGLVKDALYSIAERAGTVLGAIARIAATKLTVNLFGDGTASDGAIKRAAEGAKNVANAVFSELQRVATTTIAAIIQVVNALKPTFLTIVDTVGRLAKAFLEVKVGQFQAVVSALANIVSILSPAIQAIAGLVNAWSRFLDLPILQYVSEVAAVLGVLKRLGLDTGLMIVSMAGFMMNVGVPAIIKIGVAVGGFIVTLGLLVAALANVGLSIAAMAGAFIAPAAAIPALQAGLMQFVASMRAASTQAAQTGQSLNALGAGMQATAASAKSMALSLLTSLGKFALIQVGIALVVDLFGRFQRAQQEAGARKEAVQAMEALEKSASGAKTGVEGVTKALDDYRKAVVETRKTDLIKQLADTENAIKAQEAANKKASGGTLLEKMSGFKLPSMGADVRSAELKRLKALYAEIEAELKGIEAQQKKVNEPTAEARALQNKKDMLDKLQKELKATQELSAVKAQEAQNAIKGLQLAGQISEKDTQRLQKLAELRDVTDQLAKKQEALSKIKAIDASDTEEVRKLASEIASLQGKQIDIQLNIRRDQFDKQVEELGRTTQRRVAALTLEGQISQNQLNIAQARNSLESAQLNYQQQELEYAKENAKTDDAKWRIAQKLYQIKIRQADAEYKQAMANIANSVKQAEIEFKKVRVKEQEVRATVLLAKAQGTLTSAHQDALTAAQEATALAVENLQSTKQIAGYQQQAANWTKQAAYAGANAALQAEKNAIFTKEAKENTEAMAKNLQRASGVVINAPQLSDAQEASVRLARQQAIDSSRDPFTSYIRGVNAELLARQRFAEVKATLQQIDASQDLLGLQRQEAQNSIRRLQLARTITEEEAQRRLQAQELRNVTKDLVAKQQALARLSSVGATAEDMKQLKKDIAELEGRKIEIQLQVNKDKFERELGELQRIAQTRFDEIDFRLKLAQDVLNIEQARGTAEKARLSYILDELEYQKENAKTEAERLAFAERIRDIKKQQAEIEYKLAIAGIQSSLQQVELERQKAKIKLAEVETTVALARAAGQLNQSHRDAVTAARQALRLNEQNVAATREIAKYQAEAANWVRQSAYLSANIGFNKDRNSIMSASGTTPKFASGGFVTRPTLGLIGEGGESEYIVPQSKMFEASSRFLAGARGASVLSGSAPSSSSQPSINVTTGPVLEFNGERYVTLTDMERAMRITAEGVIGRLRTPSARIALGMA